MMMCYSPMVLIGVLSGLLFLTKHTDALEVIPATEPIKDSYIVVWNNTMKSKATVEDITQLINGGAASISEGNGNELLHMYTVIDGFAARLSPQGRANVLGSDLVESVYEDGIVRASTEWGLDRIDQRYLPLNNNYIPSSGTDGEGVTAYVIDTGVLDTHEEFEGRATQENNFVIGEDNVDCNGHGTHVAGIIGAKTYGVAKKSKIVGLKVLSCIGEGASSEILASLNWVMVNHKKPSIVNMSLSIPESNTPYNQAIENLVNAGVPVVVAAGNSGANACYYSPARLKAAITVGSTDSVDARSSFSNHGACVDIFAPGSAIKSTWIGDNAATNTISGTSMASPHVCGAVALYLSDDQDLTPDEVRTRLLEDTTYGTITDIKSESPNKLLHVGVTDPKFVRIQNRMSLSCLTYQDRKNQGRVFVRVCDEEEDEQFWTHDQNGFLINKTGRYVDRSLQVIEGTPNNIKDTFVYNEFHDTLVSVAKTPVAIVWRSDEKIKLYHYFWLNHDFSDYYRWIIVK